MTNEQYCLKVYRLKSTPRVEPDVVQGRYSQRAQKEHFIEGDRVEVRAHYTVTGEGPEAEEKWEPVTPHVRGTVARVLPESMFVFVRPDGQDVLWKVLPGDVRHLAEYER